MIDLTQFAGWGLEMPDSFGVDTVQRLDAIVVGVLFKTGKDDWLAILPMAGARALRDRLTEILEGQQ